MQEVANHFGFTTELLRAAKNRGEFFTRDQKAAAKIRTETKPRKHSNETKNLLSRIMKSRHDAGTAHTLGHNRRNQEPSWPEKWWLQVLKNEIKDQQFVTEYRFHRYSIDFAWPEKKIALEIDGEQHQRFEQQITSDRRKDSLLKEAGWKVCRVPWKECYSSPRKFIEQVKDLVD